MSKLKYFITCIILFSSCFKHHTKALDIPIIVISQNKSPQSYSTVGSSVSMINQETISNSNNFFLGETLNKNLPGMNYFRSGGYGTISGIQLRGLPKRYSTVYIDGVKMSDPSSSDNSFYFSNIMNSSIKNVEVLRGSQTSMYGSGAIGGAINIYTKDGEDKNLNKFIISSGSNNTKNLDVSYGEAYNNHSYYLGVNLFNTDGISAMNDEVSTNDNDSYKNKNIISKYKYSFNDIFSFRGNLRYSNSFLNYDEVSQGRTDDNNSSDDNELSYSLKLISDYGKHKNTFLYNHTNIERATKTYENALKNYYGYRDSINFIGEFNFNLDNKLLYGLDHEFDEAKFQKDWPTDYLKSDEAIYSQYFDFQFRPSEKVYSTIGLRRDDHTTAGSYNTGRVTLAYVLDNNSKIRSSFGTGLRFPTLYDYFYGTAVTNKEDLKPEKSKSFDVGYEKYFQILDANVVLSVFNIEYEDPLEGWQSHGWKVKNANAKIKSKGIEIASDWKFNKNFNFDINYNYSDTYDGADCDDPDVGATSCIDESIVRVPRHSWSVILNYSKNRLKQNLGLNFSDEVRDYGNQNNSFADVILEKYYLANYNFKYQINNNLDFYFNVENIFNENYEQAYMYSTMDRAFNIGISSKF